MKCDSGRLQAFLDDALAPAERAALEEHLAGCASCRETLKALRRQGAQVAQHMAALDPQAQQGPDGRRALARFWSRAVPAQTAGRNTGRRARPPRWRWAAAGLLVLAVLAALLSIAPIREATAQFLGLFRVRQFAVVPVDLDRLQHIEGLAQGLADVLNEAAVLREPGPPRRVADAREAGALAGFAVCTPAYLPGDAASSSFTVEGGPAVRVDIAREQALALLGMAGIRDLSLPQAETFSVTVDIFPLVSQEYRLGNRRLLVLQTPSPAVTIPPGIDPAQMGQAMLEFLGMPAEDAHRLAQEIDWTSTLVIPLPTNLFRFREVRVDGATGLLLEQATPGDSAEPDSIILWQSGGIVYVVAGQNVSPDVLLQVADSLR